MIQLKYMCIYIYIYIYICVYMCIYIAFRKFDVWCLAYGGISRWPKGSNTHLCPNFTAFKLSLSVKQPTKGRLHCNVCCTHQSYQVVAMLLRAKSSLSFIFHILMLKQLLQSVSACSIPKCHKGFYIWKK